MKDNSHIFKKVDEAMQSLDGIERAVPAPFFFTRLKARLEREQKSAWERVSGFVGRPAVAMAVICLVVIINAFVALVLHDNRGNKMATEQQQQLFPDEYNATVASLYDYDNTPEQ